MILRHTFIPHNNTRLTHLCGPADVHLRTIEVALEVSIAHRHEQFKVDGPKAKATQAMELLQAGAERSVIALWLGHESIQTTQIYLDANLDIKQAALDKVEPHKGRVARFRPDDQLMAFLKAL